MTIEVLQGLERKALITVNKVEVDELVKKELKKHAGKAKAQGFRPGKVPAKIVEQMYGSESFEEVLNKKVNDNFFKILLESKLIPAGYPKFELTSSEGTEFMFTALFEVMPTVTIGDLTTQTVEKIMCDIADEQITSTIDAMRRQRATYAVITDDKENRVAADTDKVTIDFVGTIDGEEFAGGSATNYPFILGQGSMLPEFEAGAHGLKVSESRDVEVNFPENYHAANLKGKKAIFKITLRELEAQQLPELTPEFIKSVGVDDGSLETLRAEIGVNLNHEVKRRAFAKTRENALNALYEVSPLEVPKETVHDEIHHMMDSTKEKMKNQGYPEDQIKLTHDMFESDAKKLVKLRFLVQELIKQQNIVVTDEDVRARVVEMAHSYDDAENYVTWYYEDKERIATARALATEQKIIDYILSVVKITEKNIGYEEQVLN
jgi:trigger factor